MTSPLSANPSAVPVRAAATLLLLSDRPDLHVLLLRRRAASDFVPGMVVFPGGALDAADGDPDALSHCSGLDDAEASSRLGLERGGLAYWVAAVRETFEEAGVLLAQRAGRPLSLADPERARRFAALRDAVDRDRLRLADVLRDEDLRIDAAAIHYAARWVTPEGPRRRYDTRFFVAGLPAGQQALHDEREAVHSEWVRPPEALARFARGELPMLPPTAGMLRLLASYSRCRDALAAAARHQHGPDVPVRLFGEGAQWRVLLPGDPDYGEDTTPIRAWVRFGVTDERAARAAKGS